MLKPSDPQRLRYDGRAVVVGVPDESCGGVQTIAFELRSGLLDRGVNATLVSTLPHLLRVQHPPETWFALTWKTYAAVLAGSLGRARPGSLFVHGAELSRDRRAWTAVRRATLEHARVILAPSPTAARLVPDRHATKVRLVGPPLREGLFAPVPRTRGSETLTLISMGRAVPRKGHDVAIHVASTLARRRPVRLRIVGAGPDLPRLRELATRHNPGLEVDVVGPCSPGRQVEFLDASDAMLFLPRREGREFDGLGMVVLEAAARGCPSVVMESGGAASTVVPGWTGELVDEGSSVERIADVVEVVAATAAYRRAAREFADNFRPHAWLDRVWAAATAEATDWTWPSRGGGPIATPSKSGCPSAVSPSLRMESHNHDGHKDPPNDIT